MGRKHYFDWIRVLAFTILIFTHVSNIFTKDGYYVVNDEKSELIQMVFDLFRLWRIPLLFFISGAVISFTLMKKTSQKYLKDKVIRLLIPLTFTFLVIIYPIFYFKSLFYNEGYLSYFDHFKAMFSDGYIRWQHMWYVAYLFVYTVAGYPLLRFLSKLKNNGGLKIKINFIAVLIMIIPLFLFESFLYPQFPFTHQLWNDYFYLAFSFTIFVYGYCFALSEKIKQVAVRNRFYLAIASIISLGIAFYMNKISGGEPALYSLNYFIFKWFKVSHILFSIFAIFGFAIKYLNFGSKNVAYANEAVYPFYILHNTILVALGYYIVRWDVSLYIKFLSVSLLTFLIAFVLYEFIIRRYDPLRFVFGCKVKSKPDPGLKHRLEPAAAPSIKKDLLDG